MNKKIQTTWRLMFLLAIFFIAFSNVAISEDKNNAQNSDLSIVLVSVDNSFPEVSTDVALSVIVETLEEENLEMGYYVSLDEDISSDDIQLGSQSLIFDENNFSVSKNIRFSLSEKLLGLHFYLGVCISNSLDQYLSCSEAVRIEPMDLNGSYNSNQEKGSINWLDELELLFI